MRRILYKVKLKTGQLFNIQVTMGPVVSGPSYSPDLYPADFFII
jgi:hypothetical protein